MQEPGAQAKAGSKHKADRTVSLRGNFTASLTFASYGKACQKAESNHSKERRNAKPDCPCGSTEANVGQCMGCKSLSPQAQKPSHSSCENRDERASQKCMPHEFKFEHATRHFPEPERALLFLPAQQFHEMS
ncbi:hypothetical protein AA0229_1182 [Gluconobacter cerinus NRIC 0229]|nr:hypothetical protein AA0229_1182 [Gluconobacter cerinus NRIC 0229]